MQGTRQLLQLRQDCPILLIGTAVIRLFFNWQACSSFLAKPSIPGVSIGPGLIALTRILRCFRSTVQVRAKDRIEAFDAL